MNILIVGGNGGIGLAMVKEALVRFPQAQIHATYRRTKSDYEHSALIWHQVDVTDEAQVKNLSQAVNSIDWVINCVGMLHTSNKDPEKNLSMVDPDFFLQNIAVNTLPSMLLAKYFTPLLKRSGVPKFAVVSAKVGSISDNRLGGWYSYRASKAALNMFIKTMSIEWQRTLKNGVVLALHPGTTNTALSEPFQANVPEGKLFTPERVASDLMGLIEKVAPQDSGAFLTYDGERLPW
ncbi:SDR family oxidoreductase [Vibrio parahaemolyticus]|nr:SDR family oxidoreductase [Vibrio parahaemolyticus]KIT56000.1 C factor cell-cell signaling protein [Vibrio parahaemolyticus 901128]EGR3178858.1 SDR family oxidoreductase [Vibrio parahaemolyticus]EHR1009173.1 SDR family oxidoreductase [Vibrio parahaemolyticus]EIE1218447.1 SDR family oxidoreductase [Vibrio parahaemolyticus]